MQQAIGTVPAAAWTPAYDGDGQVPSGHRFTCFATDTGRGQLADLELRHRQRARCEDRIRCAKDTALRNLPSRASPRTD